ncbi:MAG: hypothetical protein ACRCS9_06990 [Hyphomicrobium sp.]
MNTTFLLAARNLAAAFFELYAVSLSVEGPLSKEQIQDGSHIFHEMLLAYGMKQLITFERDVPPLSSEELQAIIVSELRSHSGNATDDELRFRAGLIVHDIQNIIY